jgi:predicted RNA binding protein YcfA (HicA-like mRNA interferase family)
MAKLVPVTRIDLIRKLRNLGFDGPFVATRHQYMLQKSQKIFIPNPHGKDIGVPLLRRIIKQLDVTVEKFNSL